MVTAALLAQLLSLLLLLLLAVSLDSVGSSVSEGSPDFTPEVELNDSEGILDSNTAWENLISQRKHKRRRLEHRKEYVEPLVVYFYTF